MVLMEEHNYNEAISVFKNVLKLNDRYLRAYSNLGRCYLDMGHLGEATKIFNDGLRIDKEYKPILKNLVDLNLLVDNFFQAEKLVYHMMVSTPNDANLFNVLGTIHEKRGDLVKAKEAINRALAIDPRHSSAKINLATILHQYGDHKKAREILEKLAESEGFNDDLENNLANIYLILGFFEIGWKKYETRWKVSPLNRAVWPIKGRILWEGQKDKKVLLWKEQGIGDDILFMGLVSEAAKVASSTIVYTDPRLVSLCQRGMPGITFKPYKGKIENEEFDYHLPMGSLPLLYRRSESDFKNTVRGYLKADKKRVENLRKEMGIGDKKVIGISWKSIKSLHTLKKSLELTKFGRIFEDLDITLVNLQYGDVDKEIKEFTRATGIEILQCQSVDNREDLDGLAALIEACDLIVSTSNVTIHLAGALGKETWVLLPYVANFWWLLNRTDSIWYPT